jgi:hypothetical protein
MNLLRLGNMIRLIKSVHYYLEELNIKFTSQPLWKQDRVLSDWKNNCQCIKSTDTFWIYENSSVSPHVVYKIINMNKYLNFEREKEILFKLKGKFFFFFLLLLMFIFLSRSKFVVSLYDFLPYNNFSCFVQEYANKGV